MVPFENLLRHYCRVHRPRSQAEEVWFRDQPTLRYAIELAALARHGDGTRLKHQRHLTDRALRRGKDALLEVEGDIQRCCTFDELFQVVRRSVNHIRGLGELYVYDTAFRIGAKLGLKPEKVYLHRGTRDGARKLGLNTRKTIAIEVAALPEPIQSLEPHEIEDFLCIYKRKFITR
jgi:hypothetical protein